MFGRDVGQEGAGIDVDGVASGRLDDGDSRVGDVVAKIGGGSDAIFEIVVVQGFLQADGDGFEVASGEAAVGGVALGEDEKIFFLLCEGIVVGAEESADVGHAIFLGGHGAAVAVGEHFLSDFFWRLVGVTFFAKFDEVGIFGEAAGVEVERDVVVLADGADGFHVFHGDGLTASGIVSHSEHD